MSFLRRLFGLDTRSCLERGETLAKRGEWGLARFEYEKARLALDDESAALRGTVDVKLNEARQKVHDKDLERATAAEVAGDLRESLTFLKSAHELLDEGDGRRATVQARIDALERRIDEASLKAEIEEFLADQGTAELVRRRRHREFALYFISPADDSLDDSDNYTTIELIELAADVEAHPDDPERLAGFGEALAQTGFRRRAIAPLTRAAELNPGDKQVHYLLGNIFASEGDLDKAVDEFDKAIELDPGFALAYLYLARTYIEAGDDEEAARLLEKALETGGEESGVPEEARELLGRLERSAPPSDVPDSLEDRLP